MSDDPTMSEYHQAMTGRETPIAAQVRAVRARLGENTTTFAARFQRSPRTIEDWEQGRRTPDPLAQIILERLARRVAKAGR